jgi:hypothetical protein
MGSRREVGFSPAAKEARAVWGILADEGHQSDGKSIAAVAAAHDNFVKK